MISLLFLPSASISSFQVYRFHSNAILEICNQDFGSFDGTLDHVSFHSGRELYQGLTLETT